MTISELQSIFEVHSDVQNAIKQQAYLKNQFPFLGLPKPKRALLEKQFVKETRQLEKYQVIDLIFNLSRLEAREYLYTAQAVLAVNYQLFDYEDILLLVTITGSNQWWENTDGFQSVLKKWFRANPDYIRPFVMEFYKDENMWMRRLAIIAQLGLKEQTDFTIMKRAIRFNFSYDEFFIQKAIGWALRDYSKTNPQAVKLFIEQYQDKLSNLAIREGSKYLN